MAYGPISLAGFGILIAYLCFMVYQWFTLYLARRRIILENGCKPIQGRYPHRDPILGLDYIFEALAAKNKGQFLLRECGLIAKLGATYIFYICGVGVVSTAEPENMKAILATSFDDFGSGERNAFLEPVLGTGIFTTDGEEWAHSRAMIRPSFTRSQIADLDRLEECMDDMLALIPSDGTEIDLQPLFFGLMMDSASAFLLGQSVQSLRDDAYATGTTKHAKHSSTTSGIPSGSEFAHAYETAQEYRAFRFLCGPFGKIGWQPKVERNAIAICRTFIESFADDAIRYRKKLDAGLADEKKGYTFLNELAKETKDRIQLRDEVMNVLTAGRDTTASMLSNLFHHLAKRPEIWAKLRTEVATLNGALPSFEQLKGMTYLQYCIKESLRLNPAVPGVVRQAIKDTVLPVGGGPDGKSPLFVKNGTTVLLLFFCMHRHEDIYGPNSHEFDPDRWETIRPGWGYIPFSGGPRICLGQQYALTVAAYVIVRLLQKFEKLESRDPAPWGEMMTLTCASFNGVKVALTRA